jgi:ribosomal protein S18 acetylase RimI-like enzyme
MKRLYARPSTRGSGIGRALAMAAIEAAAGIGYTRMLLDTLPAMTAAHGLYRQLDFEIIPPYYKSPLPGTIFMQKSLGGPLLPP